MSGSRSRRKGHRFERQVARRFREACPGFDARRGLQSREGSDAPDVIAPAPLWIECKRGKRPSIKAALRQARDAAAPGWWLVAITRADREKAIASMPLADFLELVEQWHTLNLGPPGGPRSLGARAAGPADPPLTAPDGGNEPRSPATEAPGRPRSGEEAQVRPVAPTEADLHDELA